MACGPSAGKGGNRVQKYIGTEQWGSRTTIKPDLQKEKNQAKEGEETTPTG